MPKPIHYLRNFLLPLGLAAAAVQPLAAQSDLNVAAGASLRLTESGSYQNVTVGSGGTLQTVDANSGGGGDHAITITFAAAGPGTIRNDGLITIDGNDQGNTLVLANPINLSGSGVLQLRIVYSYPDVTVQGPGTLTQAAGHTLLGSGGAVFNAPLVNAGLVTTSGSGGFQLNGSLRNTGTLSASGGAELSLGMPRLDNTGGLIAATDAQSSVNFVGGTTIVGGTLSSVNSTGSNINAGIIHNSAAATVQDVTLAAGSVFNVENPLTVAGTFTNNGYVYVGGFNFNTRVYSDLNVATDATLAGSGVFQVLGGEIDATNNATLTVAPGATLYGAGTFNANITNNGTTGSDYQEVDIYSPVFTNNGTLSVTNGGTVYVSRTTNLTNYDAGSGTLTGGTYQSIDTGNGSNLDFVGRSVKTNAATITLSGSGPGFGAISALAANAGTFNLLRQVQFSTQGDLSNSGTLTLDAGSTLHVGGAFAGAAGSTLAVTVGGTQSQGAQSAGILQVSGAAALGGNLAVTLAPGVQIAATDKLAIGSAASFGGSFVNAVNGERVATSDGSGSFQVNYGPGSAYAPGTLILSDFEQTGANVVPAFFSGQANLGSGAYYLAFRNGNVFGYYSYLSDPRYLYHFDLGYEYVFDAADGQDGVYLYDFASGTFFYTSPTFPFPYLYDFTLNTVLYYYPDPNNPGRYNTAGTRYFYNFATSQIITK